MKANTTSKKTHKKLVFLLMGVLLFLFILYWVICYIGVSLSLIPAVMEKTEMFHSITDSSIEALVQTSDIQNNFAKSWADTKEWLKNAQAEKISATTTDGYNLVATIFTPETESNKWVLLLHGYTGRKEELYPIAYRYVKEGYNALVPDMRCGGESEGDFIGMGWTDRLDNMLWLEEIISRDANAQIVIQGQSMGASCALMMSGEDLPSQVRVIVSDCAYTDAYSMFAKQMKDWFHLPSFPILDSMNLILRLRGGYDLNEASALEQVKKTSLPVLIIHGKEDDMIPVEMAYALYDAAGGPKELLIIPGAGHAQAMDKDPELFYGTIFTFLKKNLP